MLSIQRLLGILMRGRGRNRREEWPGWSVLRRLSFCLEFLASPAGGNRAQLQMARQPNAVVRSMELRLSLNPGLLSYSCCVLPVTCRIYNHVSDRFKAIFFWNSKLKPLSATGGMLETILYVTTHTILGPMSHPKWYEETSVRFPRNIYITHLPKWESS